MKRRRKRVRVTTRNDKMRKRGNEGENRIDRRIRGKRDKRKKERFSGEGSKGSGTKAKKK